MGKKKEERVWDTEECQHCHNQFHAKNISSHETNCASNPNNQE